MPTSAFLTVLLNQNVTSHVLGADSATRTKQNKHFSPPEPSKTGASIFAIVIYIETASSTQFVLLLFCSRWTTTTDTNEVIILYLQHPILNGPTRRKYYSSLLGTKITRNLHIMEDPRGGLYPERMASSKANWFHWYVDDDKSSEVMTTFCATRRKHSVRQAESYKGQ